MDFNEKKLIQGLKAGESSDFNEIFNQYYFALCKYAFLFVKDELISEEIVEECFFRLWQNRAGLKIRESLKSYLFKAVHNISLNYLQHLKVIKNYKDLHVNIHESKEVLYEEFESSPLQALQFKEFEIKLKEAIDDMPSQQKKVFSMNRFDGKKYREIADELGISITTVKSHMSSALEHLRVKLKEFL